MTEFRITFKTEHPKPRTKWWQRRAKETPDRSVVYVKGDSYFISDKDSSGYTRFVIIMYETDGTRKHQFVCNAHDVLHVIFKPL